MDIKVNIDRLSYVLNNMLSGGIKTENYSEVLKVSQELDKLILIYTKIANRGLNLD